MNKKYAFFCEKRVFSAIIGKLAALSSEAIKTITHDIGGKFSQQ
jgi:hypothetical protein